VFVHFTATEDNSILFDNTEAFKDWIKQWKKRNKMNF
jgi:hypothetical protein